MSASQSGEAKHSSNPYYGKAGARDCDQVSAIEMGNSPKKGYLRPLFLEALKHAYTKAGGVDPKAIAVPLIAGCFTLFGTWLLKGTEGVKVDFIPTLATTLITIAGTSIVMFLWDFLYATPRRRFFESKLELEQTNASLLLLTGEDSVPKFHWVSARHIRDEFGLRMEIEVENIGPDDATQIMIHYMICGCAIDAKPGIVRRSDANPLATKTRRPMKLPIDDYPKGSKASPLFLIVDIAAVGRRSNRVVQDKFYFHWNGIENAPLEPANYAGANMVLQHMKDYFTENVSADFIESTRGKSPQETLRLQHEYAFKLEAEAEQRRLKALLAQKTVQDTAKRRLNENCESKKEIQAQAPREDAQGAPGSGR